MVSSSDIDSEDYHDERDRLEESLPSALHIDPEHLAAFMEELTNLSRKYGLTLRGGGDMYMVDVDKQPFHVLQQGRYVFTWESHNDISPVTICWSAQEELSLNTIDIDKL